MKYKVRHMPKIATDLAKIKVYLAQYYTGTFRRFFIPFKEKTARLKDFPYSCPIYEADPDYRKLVVQDYIVLYMVNEGTKTVEIHRIFHGSQDISRRLADERTDIPQ